MSFLDSRRMSKPPDVSAPKIPVLVSKPAVLASRPKRQPTPTSTPDSRRAPKAPLSISGEFAGMRVQVTWAPHPLLTVCDDDEEIASWAGSEESEGGSAWSTSPRSIPALSRAGSSRSSSRSAQIARPAALVRSFESAGTGLSAARSIAAAASRRTSLPDFVEPPGLRPFMTSPDWPFRLRTVTIVATPVLLPRGSGDDAVPPEPTELRVPATYLLHHVALRIADDFDNTLTVTALYRKSADDRLQLLPKGDWLKPLWELGLGGEAGEASPQVSMAYEFVTFDSDEPLLRAYGSYDPFAPSIGRIRPSSAAGDPRTLRSQSLPDLIELSRATTAVLAPTPRPIRPSASVDESTVRIEVSHIHRPSFS
eukprot:TRINITY_DN31024_c0_g1_i1.p1 TRINITY_DN31024_c0_g1~~TRINITY_DN31024_c0_g1_i1.p1  ORF type:complete len:367 (+),score=85.42 TRINITY_DN31024_c0_g1_i1:241-1341(+)